ncbi:hypothetical protein JOE61_000171 [Nocardioides salarius]|uniref:Uncharacterized protein n=1 Tax=Nocardioides salarius TaxID=374513 RepID=A0ABS2M5A8_9ACTN|nr:hypothetical protein [Nocardioides salarius]MBM7506357.1 hypothetical protein [Nocardioides salarius]
MTTTRTARSSAFLAAAVLSLPLALGACSSGDDVEAYCAELADSVDELGALGSGGDVSFGEVADAFDQLGDAAPDEVAEQWETLNEGLAEVEDRLDEAGLSMDELDTMMSGEGDPEADLEKLEAMGSALEGLEGEELDAAGEEIEEHALAECDITLE